MTNMAAMPIYGKNLKKSSSLEPKVNDLESLYVASCAGALPNLFQWWPWVDIDLFYGKSDLVPYAFVWVIWQNWIFQKLL